MVLQRVSMEIHFVGRNHDKKVIFEESISVRQALNIADIQPSTVIVSFEENIIPHSTCLLYTSPSPRDS